MLILVLLSGTYQHGDTYSTDTVTQHTCDNVMVLLERPNRSSRALARLLRADTRSPDEIPGLGLPDAEAKLSG